MFQVIQDKVNPQVPALSVPSDPGQNHIFKFPSVPSDPEENYTWMEYVSVPTDPEEKQLTSLSVPSDPE